MQAKLALIAATSCAALVLVCDFGASGARSEAAATVINGKIAFTISRGRPPPIPPGPPPDSSIFVMNGDGTDRRRMTQPGMSSEPDWSPDGSKIAFQAYSTVQDSGIYTMNADGGRVMRLTNSGEIGAGQPDWSPDGKKIVFIALQQLDYCGFHLWVMNADGSNSHRLTAGCREERDPAWSPNGSAIAYTAYTGLGPSANWDIHVADGNGRNVRRLTAGGGWAPAWSPDGSKIVFASDRAGVSGVYIMNADGSHPTRLTSNRDSTPAWSPDGKKIVFSRDDGDLYVMNPDGSAQVNLTKTPDEGESQPDWQAKLPPCLVPRVIGLRLVKARGRIRRANCTVGRVRRRHSRRVGRVIEQKPRAGARRPGGTRVSLVVGRR